MGSRWSDMGFPASQQFKEIWVATIPNPNVSAHHMPITVGGSSAHMKYGTKY